MLFLLCALAHAEPASFHPNAGSDRVSLDADGTLRGLARTGEILLRADDPEALAALADVAEVRVLRGGVARIRPAPGVDDVALANALRERDDVAWAHPDFVVRARPASVPDDPYLASQWHLQNTGQYGYVPGVDIRAAEAWDVTRGAGQLVAIVDSGVDIDHPDLSVVDGHDYVEADESSDVGEGGEAHGTACAGLAAGRGDNGAGTTGVAYEAEAYGIRIIGGYTTLSDTFDAFQEAVDAGATVISNSWGWDDGCGYFPEFGVVTDAIEMVEAEGRGGLGAAVVFAAGNGNCDITENGMLKSPTVITVAAVSGFDVREGYSAFGPWVDIAAPSGMMSTTDILGPAGYNGYPYDDAYTNGFNGTSAATPVVSGVLALMFAANDRLTAADARDVLCDTAVRVDLAGGDWDEAGWSPYYGCGRVDAGAAVRAVANLGAPELPVPLGPAEATPEEVVLAWEDAVDPDGDHVSYKVRWSSSSHPDEQTVDTDRPWLDLTGQVDVDDEVTWKVRAVDLWGQTEWSADQVFVVAAPPEPEVVEVVEAEPKGCAHAPGSGGLGVLAVVSVVALRALRRRRA